MMPKIACVRDSDRCARNLTNSPDSSDVAPLTTASVSEPEVRLLDVRALLERLARAVQDDAPVLEDVGAVRERERARDVLLDEQDGRAALVDPLQILEDQPDHHGSEAEAWLVQQQQPRARHEPAADGAHLLLAARERAGHLPLALAQARDEGDHFARVHLQRELAHGHEVAVAGLDAIEAEQRGHIPRPGTPR